MIFTPDDLKHPYALVLSYCCPAVSTISAVVGVPELTGVHAVAAIPALTDDQCHAIAGFPVVHCK
jgi:hypothetical protein